MPDVPRRADGPAPRRLATVIAAIAPRLLRGVVTAAVTCLPVGVLAVLVRTKFTPLVEADRSAIVAATDITRANPGLRDALIVWQEVFLPWHVYLAAAPLAVLVYRSGLRARAIWGTVTMLVGWNLGLDVKLLVQRARPELADPVSSAPGFSFPSGHAFNTAMAISTCLVMAWPLLRDRSRAVRTTVVAVGATLIVLTALDRVLLGVHFPSDVTAGVLLAIALTASSWIGFSHQPGRRTSPRGDS